MSREEGELLAIAGVAWAALSTSAKAYP